MAEQRKVRQAREQAEHELHELLGRLTRLRRQESSLQARGAELFERGMQEEREEEAESAVTERQQVIGELQSFGAFGVLDWDALGVDFSASVPVGPGSSGGTDQVVGGSS